jgi:predicted NACHT family NTPase
VVFISLPEVYIALKTANPFYKPMASEHKKENNEPVELEKASKTIAVEDLLGQWKCLLLRGDAGMGKTTLIKHLAYTMTHETSPGPLDGYLPVMVFLKDFWTLYKNALRDRQDNLTFEILLAAYLEKICCPLPMETITAYLAQDRALFLIDGLDEVPDEIRAALVDIIHQFQFKHNQNLFLITGRPHGIEGRALYCFGKHLRDIEPLSGQKVEEFIKRWFRAVSRQAQGLADVNAMYLISKIKLHEHTAVFTGNPLLLTALCVFCLVDGKRIPDQRADLYDRIVANLLYRRFYDPADMDKEIKVCEYLMDLAFTMHSDNIKSIEPYKARDLLMQKEHYPILADELPHEYKKRIEELFNGIEPVCGILNRLGSGEIEFAHLTFQEFLAAKQLLDRGMDYKPYLKNSWWKESLLLYLGLMNLDMKKPSNDLACKIIKNYKKPRIQLIGAKAIQDFQATRREEYALNLARESLLTIIQSNTSLAERFEAGEILGHLGDPRIDVFNPPMVLVKAGEFTRGSEKRNDEKPVRQIYLDEYMMGKYPVTNAEFKIFIQEGGYNQEEYWTMEGWQWREEEKISEPLIWYERRWNGPNFPVVGVSWYEASAYANWLSKKTGYSYCLPTEVQWEKAACGSRGFQYPWGNDFDKD